MDIGKATGMVDQFARYLLVYYLSNLHLLLKVRKSFVQKTCNEVLQNASRTKQTAAAAGLAYFFNYSNHDRIQTM